MSAEIVNPQVFNKSTEAFIALEQRMFKALETYSNVHRGSGHHSMASTHLYEQARELVLEYLELKKSRYLVIFCSLRGATELMKQLEPGSFQLVSAMDIGLSLGVRALAVRKNALPKGIPFQSGGGTTKLVSPGWVIWADGPDKFEAGTPAIINVIAFGMALRMIRQSGKEFFRDPDPVKKTVDEILFHDELDPFTGKELLLELRKTLIGRGKLVPTMEGERPYINLDNSASTPTFTPVWDAFRNAWRQPKQVQQEIIEEVRSICAAALGAPLKDYDLVFTSNTTEALNLAAENLSRISTMDEEPVVLNTILEHSSNDLPWRMIPGCSLLRLSVDKEGFFDLKELQSLLCGYNQEKQFGKKRIKLVAVSGASNVLGVCNDLREISRVVHQYGAHLLVDAAQLIAHRKVTMEECGIDYLAFSAHKVYAPFGTGVLIARKGLLQFSIAEMEMIRLSGEENAGGIAALGKSLVLLQRIGMDLVREEEQALTRRLLTGMSEVAGITIFGIKDPESPGFASKAGVILFGMKGMMANRVAKELALQRGIGVRYGCHCAHIIIKRLLNVPPLLESFQRVILTLFPKIKLPGLARVSLGIQTTEEEVDTLIRVLKKITEKPTSAPGLSKADVETQMQEYIHSADRAVYS